MRPVWHCFGAQLMRLLFGALVWLNQRGIEKLALQSMECPNFSAICQRMDISIALWKKLLYCDIANRLR